MRPHLERTPTRHTNRCATPQTAPEWRCLSAVQPHAQFRVFAYVSAGLVGDVAFRPRKIDFFASFWFSFFFLKKMVFFWIFFFSLGAKTFKKNVARFFFWRYRVALTLSSSKTCLFPSFEKHGYLPGPESENLGKSGAICQIRAQCVENEPGFTTLRILSAGKSESCSRKSNTEGRVHRR